MPSLRIIMPQAIALVLIIFAGLEVAGNLCPTPTFDRTTTKTVTDVSMSSMMPYKAEVEYRCKRGYYFEEGDTKRIAIVRCQRNATWQRIQPCKQFTPDMVCSTPEFDTIFYQVHTALNETFFPGEKVKYSCAVGYNFGSEALQKRNAVRSCTTNSTWSPLLPCYGYKCPAPRYNVTTTEILSKPGPVPHNTEVKYRCKHGYYFESTTKRSAIMKCRYNATWQQMQPCQPIPPGKACPAPDFASTLYLAHTDLKQAFFFHDRVKYSCKDGYEFKTDDPQRRKAAIFCTRNSTWSHFESCYSSNEDVKETSQVPAIVIPLAATAASGIALVTIVLLIRDHRKKSNPHATQPQS
ncbi:complement factor H-related protein 4-like [Sycon ciliatum]|uniref:complement factor H-related protein 4-like n=1 Tax=Sycon ciliatum TaxID=27933 RepID=UPI0031F6DCD1